jgi:hypothetical protein
LNRKVMEEDIEWVNVRSLLRRTCRKLSWQSCITTWFWWLITDTGKPLHNCWSVSIHSQGSIWDTRNNITRRLFCRTCSGADLDVWRLWSTQCFFW